VRALPGVVDLAAYGPLALRFHNSFSHARSRVSLRKGLTAQSLFVHARFTQDADQAIRNRHGLLARRLYRVRPLPKKCRQHRCREVLTLRQFSFLVTLLLDLPASSL
jgi:hypothetical protein